MSMVKFAGSQSDDVVKLPSVQGVVGSKSKSNLPVSQRSQTDESVAKLVLLKVCRGHR